jgi:2-aminoethylphosphonate-pyruvate transaminase
MDRPTCALILAAGMGRRIQGAFAYMPKGFLDFGEGPIIERSINLLKSVGIESIVIVTGYQARYYERLAEQYPGIQLVKNEKFARSGSMYSLYQARSIIRSPFLLLDSDLVYESRALEQLVEVPWQNTVLASGFTAAGDEVYVELQGEYVSRLSKEKESLNNIVGESVGIAKVGEDFLVAMFAFAERAFQDSLFIEYEEAINSAASHQKMHFLKIDNLVWGEIDDEEHYRRVKQSVYPELMRLDSCQS